MPGLTFVILVAAIGALVLIPTRRLYVGGWTSGPLAVYFVGMILLGLLVAELRGPARYLVPVLVLAYIAPFVTMRQGLDRIRERLTGHAPPPPPMTRGADDDAQNVRDARSRSTAGFDTASRGGAGGGPRPAPRNVTPPESGSSESSRNI